MTIRKRNDADGWKRGAMGIDGREGDHFTKQYAVDPYKSNPRGDFKTSKGAGVYQDEAHHFCATNPQTTIRSRASTLRPADARDIFDAVEGQSSDSGNRAVKSGNKD